MKEKAVIRENISLNAHPEGCRQQVFNTKKTLASKARFNTLPLNALIIGGSSGYGLASALVLATNGQADIINVHYERPPQGKRQGSPGFYNAQALKACYPNTININMDCFSHQAKQAVIDLNKKIDLIVYSVASGVRVDPDTKEKYLSFLKPIGSPYQGLTIDIAKETLKPVTLSPASTEEIANTVKVMGGEDLKLWCQALDDAGCLAQNCRLFTYTYIGSSLTDPIYRMGTIGMAKRDLEKTVHNLPISAQIVAAQATVTKASVFIPTMPLYVSALMKVMKEQGCYESIDAHIYRLFRDMVFGNQSVVDKQGILRLDQAELDPVIQAQVLQLLKKTTPENFKTTLDFEGFKQAFLNLSGFNEIE